MLVGSQSVVLYDVNIWFQYRQDLPDGPDDPPIHKLANLVNYG